MAIDDLLDEHEQGERVRAWLRRNGVAVLIGIVLGLAVIGGWQWWQQRRLDTVKQAGASYEALLGAVEARDVAKAKTEAAALQGTAYAVLGALELAKVQVDAGQLDAAIATLHAARSEAGDLTALLEGRLARLLTASGKHAEAIGLLSAATDGGALETRGDAELAAGKPDAARDSYRKALEQADEGSPRRRLLELKLSEVGGTTVQPEARS